MDLLCCPFGRSSTVIPGSEFWTYPKNIFQFVDSAFGVAFAAFTHVEGTLGYRFFFWNASREWTSYDLDVGPNEIEQSIYGSDIFYGGYFCQDCSDQYPGILAE